MKSLSKVEKLTNNPITLLLGRNHYYLQRTMTSMIRLFISILVLFWLLLSIAYGNLKDGIQALIFIWAIFFFIDKLRIKGHLNSYNLKFQQALGLLRDKYYVKSIKKFLKLGGLKEPIMWIIENEPQTLLGSLSDRVDRPTIEKLMKCIERKDVDGIIGIVKSNVVKLAF